MKFSPKVAFRVYDEFTDNVSKDNQVALYAILIAYAKEYNAETRFEKSISFGLPFQLKFSPKVAFRVYDEFTDNVSKDNQGNLYVNIDLPSIL